MLILSKAHRAVYCSSSDVANRVAYNKNAAAGFSGQARRSYFLLSNVKKLL